MSAPFKHPDLVKIPLGVKLPRWLVEWMREEVEQGEARSMAVLIEEALIEKHHLMPPEVD